MPGGPDAGPRPIGRDAQIAVIESVLADIAVTGTWVALRGDPGMGRTALLNVAGTLARGAGLRVLRMTGAQAESGLPFAALHQVLWPLLDDTAALPEDRRHALESALGVRDGTPPAAVTVGEAAHTLLVRAAARLPVVVLLDDLQWADPSSVAVFEHLRRHLAPLPVVVIAATRPAGVAPRQGGGGTGDLPGRVIDLGPLDDRQAERLLRTLHPGLPEETRRRVLAAAAGNPLALHELPAQLRRAAGARPTGPGTWTAGIAELFDELPLGERLGRLYEDRLRALPDGARQLLLVAALGGSLADPAGQPSWPQLQETIEASGLAHADPETGRPVFRHPLVRACLLHSAAPAERRAAHRLLADSLPAGSPRRLTHLAAATVGTDGALAALLHAEADGMAALGTHAEAAAMMARAAGVSPDPAGRAARLVAAAAMAARGGRPRAAAGLLTAAESEAHPGRPEPAALHAFAVACTRLQLDGDPAPAIEVLPGALDLPAAPAAGEPHSALRASMLLLLVLVAVHTGDERAWAAAEHHAADTSGPAALCLRAWSGPCRTSDDVPDRLRAAVAALPGDRQTPEARLLLWTVAALDAVGEHRALWNRLARRPAYACEAFADVLRAHDDFLHGRWEASLTVSRRGAETSAAHGRTFDEMLFLQNVAQVLAARGDRAGLAALEPTLGTWARERGIRSVTERLRALQVLCALGHGRAEDAWRYARRLAPPGTVPSRTPWFHLSLVDWVQAAVDSGRPAQARRHLRAVRESALARVSEHHGFLVAVAEALAATDDEADRMFAAVYAHPGAGSRPFPLARARLAHGRLLHRRGRGEPAADHLRAALAAFTRLGAAPWAEQAARALGAAETDRPAPGEAGEPHPLLSAQELRIAELAAEGLTNRQIGERLGLSPRTIGAHLYKIFPKLGITTRGGVARALAGPRNRPSPPAGPAPGRPVR
ncbi:AAA family ATPase [Streptomyces sp. NPDC001544]|uniref:AAA family ATPase n=1 Tax=Streptomyces sp. NPDC001544 TaxID=3364584 RepID=UPI0036C61D06